LKTLQVWQSLSSFFLEQAITANVERETNNTNTGMLAVFLMTKDLINDKIDIIQNSVITTGIPLPFGVILADDH
jgi:hypothetical protein